MATKPRAWPLDNLEVGFLERAVKILSRDTFCHASRTKVTAEAQFEHALSSV